MSVQAADSFLTGSRGASGVPTVGTTITGWSPSSDGKNYVAQAATSTFAYDGVGFRGSTTGSTTANIATLNDATGRAWYSSAPVYGDFLKTAAAHAVGVIPHLPVGHNYYRTQVTNHTF